MPDLPSGTVTLLFTDVEGSTRVLRALGGERYAEVLAAHQRLMRAAFAAHGGREVDTQGDAFFVAFPRAVDAVLAAVDAQRALAAHPWPEGATVRVRMGLHTGEPASVGGRYVGLAVHRAARVGAAGHGGQVLLSEATQSVLRDRLPPGLALRDLGQHRLKDFDRPEHLYQLLAPGLPAEFPPLKVADPAPLPPLPVPLVAPDTPLVGREREAGLLREQLTAALGGRGGLVLIGGEAGIGKTALAETLAREALDRGARVAVGRCYDLTETPPYGPWREALAAVPAPADLPPLPEALDPAGQGEAVASQGALFARVQDFLAASAAGRPLVLLLDDLHWADPGSLDLLRFLARRLPALPLLPLVTYRADELARRHPLAQLLPLLVREARAARLDLRALPDDAVRSLVRGRYTLPDADERRLAAYLRERAEGHPLFVGELLRTLEEEGALHRADDGWHLGDLGSVRVPRLLRQVIEGRLGRLGEEDERLLGVAAVIGQDVPLDLWAALGDTQEEELLGAVERAGAARLLEEAADGARVRFVHALIREALYEGVAPARRRLLHRRAGEALAAMPGADPDAVASHFRHAGDPRALEWLLRAAERAQRAYARVMAHSAQREAAAYAERALAALAHLPEGRDTLEQSIELRFQLRHALWALGEFGRIREVLTEADRLAAALGDDRRRGWAALYLCASLYAAAEHERAVHAGERALALGTELGDETLRALALINLGQAHVARTDYERAVELAGRAVDLLGGELLHDRLGQGTVPSVLARVVLARGLVELGRFADAIAAADEAVRIAEEVDHPGSLALACKVAGLPHLRRGDPARAVPAFERGLGICRELGFPTYAHWIAPALGLAYALAGRVAEAEALLEQTLAEGAAMHLYSQHSFTVAYLGEALLLAGRDREALERATEALELARSRNERGYQAYALRLLGDIMVRAEPSDERAETPYREALRLADDLGMRPLAAHCRLGLGTLHRRTGRPQRAREHLAAATTLYRELGMTRWLGQAEAALGEVSGHLPG